MVVSPVNEWTEINSAWEGRFMERFAPGAWAKTIRDNSSDIRSLFQHGMDPQVGDKPLGPIRTLEETDRGLEAEVALLDTSYNRDLLPGLRAGLYGDVAPVPLHASRSRSSALALRRTIRADCRNGRSRRRSSRSSGRSRSRPIRARPLVSGRSPTTSCVAAPKKTPKGCARCSKAIEKRMDSEDVGTLADMLVCSNQYIEEQDEGTPAEAAAIVAMQGIQAELIKLMNVEAAEEEPSTSPKTNGPSEQEPAPSTTDAAKSTSVPERRETTSAGPLVLPVRTPRPGLTPQPEEGGHMAPSMMVEERQARITEIIARQQELDTEFRGMTFSDDAKTEFEALAAERVEHEGAITELEQRAAYLEEQAGPTRPASPAPSSTPAVPAR
jgi:hypothetical protein